MHLFIYSALRPAARAYLLERLPENIEVTFRADLPLTQQTAAFQSAEVLLGNLPVAWFGDGPPPNLQFWQIDSAGFERYSSLRINCPVANMGDFFAWPCAETMVAGVLGLYRRIPELAVLQAEKKWVGAPIRTRQGLLRGKRVIILGAGAIGLAVRQQLAGFECEVQLLARSNPEAQLHTEEALLAALPNAEIVVNCLPGSAKDFFSTEMIAAMAVGSIYASVGRGNTTDEPALLAALKAERIGGAVLDVTADEPLPPSSPLWTLPNVLLTQHTGGGQPFEDEGKIDVLLRNLNHLQHDEPLENLVDLTRGY
jgi:glyoxylate/hydroxypyruvate reductase A